MNLHKTMQIRLVKDGIFPVVKDKDGKLTANSPMTGFSSSATFQGEGKLLGVPSLFVRLSGCNLRCVWAAYDGSVSMCDTPYSSHHASEFEDWNIDDVIKTIENNLNGVNHIIISGGEPLLQAEAVTVLAKQLKKMNLHITLETNGTLFYAGLLPYIDLFSISPKLSNSTPDSDKNKQLKVQLAEGFTQHQEKTRKNLEVIQKYINACYESDQYYSDHPESDWKRKTDKDFQIKFVVGRTEDESEIKNDFLAQLKRFDSEDVLLMPLGENREFLKKTYPLVAEMALRNRWRFTPRLHIELFNDTQWV